jgi:RecB family exonuclease
MVRRLGAWLRASTREVVGTEIEFAVDVGRARLRGRVDRLERDAQGRAVVVDVKTGSAKAKKAELPRHAQLGTYQVAAEHGAFAGHELHGSGGAELVQVGVKSDASHTVQRQAPMAEDVDPEWATRLVVGAAEGMAAAGFPALVNQYCDRCPVRTSCPLRDEGRTVTGGPP